MSGKFRKSAAKRPKPKRKKSRAASKKPIKPDVSKTPVTRVGDGQDHHDTISTKTLYVLVDQPKAPEDGVTLDLGTRRWPMLFTTDAEPLYDSVLVFAIAFEHVPDAGKLTLALRRGESSQEVQLLTDVESKDIYLGDLDLLFDANSVLPKDVHGNRRFLDYGVIPDHPFPDDQDLDWPEGAYASLTSGS